MINETLYDTNEKALKNGIEAKISIQFAEEPNGKMSVLSCSIFNGYRNVDYSLALRTPLKEVIEDLLS